MALAIPGIDLERACFLKPQGWRTKAQSQTSLSHRPPPPAPRQKEHAEGGTLHAAATVTAYQQYISRSEQKRCWCAEQWLCISAVSNSRGQIVTCWPILPHKVCKQHRQHRRS
eukprot:836446-Pelagomonas_calceolata.AAC.3